MKTPAEALRKIYALTARKITAAIMPNASRAKTSVFRHYHALLEELDAKPLRVPEITYDIPAAFTEHKRFLEKHGYDCPDWIDWAIRNFSREDYQYTPPEHRLKIWPQFVPGLEKDYILLHEASGGAMLHETAHAAFQAKYDEHFKRDEGRVRHGIPLLEQTEVFACLHYFLLHGETDARKSANEWINSHYTDDTLHAGSFDLSKRLMALPGPKIAKFLRSLPSREYTEKNELEADVEKFVKEHGKTANTRGGTGRK